MSKAILKINGKSYSKWERVFISRSMDTMSGAWGFSTTDFFPSDPNGWNIKNGDPCVVMIDKQVVATGYIDNFDIEYDDESHFVKFTGRDKTADLIDCSFVETENEWKNQTIQAIITNLCAPYGIEVIADPEIFSLTSTVIESFKADEGEIVSEIISRLCRDNGILPMSYGDGKLTITKDSIRRMNDTLAFGENIISATLNQSNIDRFSNYIVKGQGASTANKTLSDYISPTGANADSVITRYRPFVIFSETPTDSGKCLRRAKWENRIRAGKSRSRTYIVEGWTQSNGKIWDINSLVSVKDEFLNTKETLLITDVQSLISKEEGEISAITVIDPTSYDLNSTKIIKTGFDR